MKNKKETVVILVEELVRDSKFLQCLYRAGIDKWEGFEVARKEFLQKEKEVNDG